MAYKFQLGDALMSGSLVQQGTFDLEDDAGARLYHVTSSTGAVSGSSTLYHAGAATFSSTLAVTGAVSSAAAITAGTSFIIGSADLNEADMEKLDGITNGTAAANKALVADGNVDITGLRNLTGTGAITAGTSFVIGSADLNEADMEKLDGITNGTAAANKAVVLDASKNIATIGTVGCGAITSTGASSLGSLGVGAVSGSSTLQIVGTIKSTGAIATSGSLTSAGATITGTSALSAITATTYSGSSTLIAQGNATFGGLVEITGALQVDGTVVNFPNVAAAALDAADLFVSLDSTTKDMQLRTRTNVVSDIAGTTSATALAAASGVLSLDIDSLSAETIATGDTIVFNDDGDDGLHKVTFDNMITKTVPLLTEAVMTVADDYVVFLDGGASGDGKKEKWADLVGLMAGAGLSAANGVLSSDASPTPTSHGDANATLVEGMNYSAAAFSAARQWTLPASPDAGDVVSVKAPANAATYNLTIAKAGSQTIDGGTTIVLESDNAAVELVYLGSDKWAIK
ncbi:MAG TPA: hypothetical protein DGZ24_01190 [Rhodospirillaceae bacterium]|nr:hypothetical protein [Rhodospirillaceae bacterium]|tara:strand:- start:1562 stop:3112 length:1551 start_codon:yes stop_codon:yes gene_type:complete